MDSFFGIGPLELVVILAIAFIVMGPERIGQFARWFGRLTVQLQTISRGFRQQLNAELDSVDESGELRSTMDELQALRQQVNELRDDIKGGVKDLTGAGTGAVNDVQSALTETTQSITNSIQPPKSTETTMTITSSVTSNGQGNNGSAGANQNSRNEPPPMPTLLDVADDPDEV